MVLKEYKFFIIAFFIIFLASIININSNEDSNNKIDETIKNSNKNVQLILQDPFTLSTKLTNCSIHNSKKINVNLINLPDNITAILLSENKDFSSALSSNNFTVGNKIIIPFQLSNKNGLKSIYAKIKTSDLKEEETSAEIILDTKEPTKVNSFSAKPGISKINLSWTTPNDDDFEMVMIRYSTDNYPLAIDSGYLLNYFYGKQNESYVTIHEHLSNTSFYYYSIFSLDKAKNYSEPLFAKDKPLANTEGFAITAPSIVMAGEDFGITIQVLREDETLNSDYTGGIDLSIEYLNPSHGKYTFYHTKPIFENGIATVTMNYSDAGTFRIKGTGTNGSSLYGESNQILSAPAEFKVETEKNLLYAGDEFKLTVTPVNAFLAPTPNYKNENLKIDCEVIDPKDEKGSFNKEQLSVYGITSFSNLIFNEAGTIKITIKDTTYIPGIEITGESNKISFMPYNFEIINLQPYHNKPFYYIDEPFDIKVKALSKNGNITKNYNSTIILKNNNDDTNSIYYTFLKEDKGEHIFKDLKGKKDGPFILSVFDSKNPEISGEFNQIEIKYGEINIIDAKGAIGEIETQVLIKDNKGVLISDDNSTEFTVDIIDPNFNNSASLDFNKILKVQNGSASLRFLNTEAETIFATPYTITPLKTKTGKITFVPSNEISPFNNEGGVRIIFWKEQKE